MDKGLLLDKLFGPGMTGLVVGGVSVGITLTEAVTTIASTNPQLVGNLIFGSIGVMAISGTAVLSAFGLKDRIVKVEKKNKVNFSKLLTVSRVFLTRKSTMTPVMKKIDDDFDSGFVAELHFVGKDKSDWKNISSPLQALRDGFDGLAKLATACEQNDPNLEGINLFGGESNILSSKFEKFGFKIFRLDEIKRSFFARVADGVGIFHETEPTVFPNGAEANDKMIHYGVITRESLIENKSLFERFAKK